MSGNPNEFYSREEKEAMADELRDLAELQETDEHHAVDDGYCSCGVLCETGTGLQRHLRRIAERKGN